MESFDADDMRDYREAQQKRRAERLPIRQQEIESLSPDYEIKKLSEYQFRVNGILDLYPIHKNYHNLRTNKRGKYTSALGIVKLIIK